MHIQDSNMFKILNVRMVSECGITELLNFILSNQIHYTLDTLYTLEMKLNIIISVISLCAKTLDRKCDLFSS